MEAVRIVVIDDHPLFRDGVMSLFSREPGFQCVGEGACGEDAIRIAQKVHPDVMLLDVSMPGGGLTAIEAIRKASPGTRIIMLTVSEERDDVMAALERGASGYLLKGIHKDELVRAIKSVHAGTTIMDPSLAVRIIGHLRSTPGSSASSGVDLEQLTQREKEVLDYVSRGLSNKEIANNLKLSHRTVKNYMTSIMIKLQVRNRVEAVLSLQRGSR